MEGWAEGGGSWVEGECGKADGFTVGLHFTLCPRPEPSATTTLYPLPATLCRSPLLFRRPNENLVDGHAARAGDDESDRLRDVVGLERFRIREHWRDLLPNLGA